MSKTNLPNIDLNLLVVLDKIFSERSLTQAGKKLFLTQSAISHALSKLRDHFDDQLFIRLGNRMEPTALCRTIHHKINPSLRSIMESLDDRGVFNPLTSKRTFCLGLSDYLCKLLLPEILQKLGEQAPGVSIRIVQTTYEQRLEMLKNDRLDLFLGCLRKVENGVKTAKLFEDHEVCIVRHDHHIKNDVMTDADLNNSKFIALSLSESGLGFLEDFLYRRRIQHNIKIVVQQETVIPSLVEYSDLIGIIAERLAQRHVATGKFRIIRLPLADTKFEIFQHWHTVHDNDYAHIWMRNLIQNVALNL
ncbi:LysR family transcriptional regulator [Maridesulfovibrio zosterae]|uniref:LysR family transcriptional regulator n=1 Tax=Maridesulfovibrio zosterae TaxID=82171 RepID=UPI00042528E5|nr:LysR family transcriptional regulator [Maridesulfovibrio zosterae]